MDKEILKIKQKLEKERNEIERILKEIHYENISTDVLSEDEIADIYEKNKESEALENDLVKRITKINRALEKINDGSYGICDSCGKKIEKERIHLDPASIECSTCSNK